MNDMQRKAALQKSKHQAVRRFVSRFRSKDLAKAFATWRKDTKKTGKMELMDGLIHKFNSLRSNGIMQKLFYAWKAFHLKQKYTAVSEELNIERPKREGLQQKIAKHKSRSMHRAQTSAVRAIAKQLGGQVGSYFSKWKLES